VVHPSSLIINSPYTAATQHWVQGPGGELVIRDERRPAGYEVFDIRNNTRRTESLEFVNDICRRVDDWCDDDYPGVTSVSRAPLERWRDGAPGTRRCHLYLCPLEAIETMIGWVEAVGQYLRGVRIPRGGGPWERLCGKMTAGAGKTTVMGMIIAWQVPNAQTYPRRNRDFSRAVFVVAPSLTVKERSVCARRVHVTRRNVRRSAPWSGPTRRTTTLAFKLVTCSATRDDGSCTTFLCGWPMAGRLCSKSRARTRRRTGPSVNPWRG
jgi:hypothetical protein